MPAAADPELAARLAKATADLYGDAAVRLLGAVARRLARGVDEPGWPERKLLEILSLRDEALAVVAQLQANGEQLVGEAIESAVAAGERAAVADLTTVEARAAFTGANRVAVQTLVTETLTAVRSTHVRLLRSTLDAYRTVVAEASLPGVVTGTETRRQAAQRALDRFASRGVTGFVDRSGRGWELESYVEMATRTGAGRAHVAGSLARYEAAGRDLVIVSDAPEECEVCRRWEGRVLSISGRTPGYPTVARATAEGLLHANCFPADVVVSGPPVRAADARRYEGELVVIHTAGGDELPVTPNHPVLTAEGWVAAGSLHVGDHLVRHLDAQRMGLVCPDNQRVPSRIGEVAGALRQAGSVVTVSVPATPEQFHGDGFGGDVDVVLADRLLGDAGDATLRQPCGHEALVSGRVGLRSLLTGGAATQVLRRAADTSYGVVGGSDLATALLLRHRAPLPSLGLASADLGASLDDPLADAALADAEGGRQLALRLASSVTLDQVVDLGRRQASCHVYNLQTAEGWYTANGIVVHNCRHALGAYVPGLTKRFTATADAEGDAERQHQRYLERGIRRWKRREAAALDEPARRAAAARKREWQGRMRTFVDEHDRKRLPAREQIGSAR